MSEQIHQNQNIPTEEEMRARDDAIFNTVAEFRNELDNPATPEQPKVQEFEGIGEDDAAQKVDVNAIFDNRKVEVGLDPLSRRMTDMKPGSGRHRKEFNLDENKAGLQRDVLTSITDRKHRGLPEEHREAFGMVAEYKAPKGDENTQDSDADISFEGMSLEEAEKAARNMPRIEQAGVPAETTTEVSTVPAPTAQTGGRHRVSKGKTPRVMQDGQVGAGYTGSVRIAGIGKAAGASAPSQIDNLNAPLDNGSNDTPENEGSSEPDVVTPEARRRDRVIARLGKMVNTDQIRTELGAARDEIRDSWRQFMQERAARKAVRIPGESSLWARHGDKLTVAAAGLGVAAVAAGLGIHHSNIENEARAAVSATPTPGESASPFGPQAPKSSETPSLSASSSTAKETPKAKPTTRPTTGPTAIPRTPDFTNKPHVKEPQGPTAGAERQQTKDLDHESISFTTKDGKVVRATATLKSGGSIFEAGHDAGLTDTEVANAVNKAGITSQRAERLPVGQQINFDQQPDGSYVVHLR